MVDTERWKLEVTGRVQMVNYRSRVQQLAEERGIVGRVWNDETNERLVHVEAQGSYQALADFSQAMGAPYGRAKPSVVKKVETLPSDGALVDFEVKRGEVHLETLERMEVAGEVLGQLHSDTKSGFAQLGGKVDSGFAQLGGKVDSGFAQLGGKVDSNFAQLGGKVDSNFAQLGGKMDTGFAQLGANLGGKIDAGFQGVNDALKRIEALLSTEVRSEILRLSQEVEAMKMQMSELQKHHVHTPSESVPSTG
jgi:acylphosphatase